MRVNAPSFEQEHPKEAGEFKVLTKESATSFDAILKQTDTLSEASRPLYKMPKKEWILLVKPNPYM